MGTMTRKPQDVKPPKKPTWKPQVRRGQEGMVRVGKLTDEALAALLRVYK